MGVDHYIKESSKRTPWIILEPGKILIMGRSIPDNPGEFYTPVLNWVIDYVKIYKGETKIYFGFEYLNTASTKWIFIMLREIAAVKEVSSKSCVYWFYEQGDDDMSELGHILRSLIECPFEISEVDVMDQTWYYSFISVDPASTPST